jgi:type IV secretory pathway VirB2 component (pilin)
VITINYFLGESRINGNGISEMRYVVKKLVVNKRISALALLLVICTFSAADDEFGLDETISMVLQMFSSPWVKGIACIALIVECIGLITARRQKPGDVQAIYPLDRRDRSLYGGGHYHQQVYLGKGGHL